MDRRFPIASRSTSLWRGDLRIARTEAPATRIMSTDPTLAAFEARIRGDRTVDPYELYREINVGIARRDPRYLGRPLAWQTSMLDRWYKDLTSYTTRAASDTLYDRLQKASIIMETDLWAYEGSNQRAFKQQLFNSLRQYYYDIKGLDQKSIAALNILLHTSRRYVAPDLFMSMQQAIKQAV